MLYYLDEFVVDRTNKTINGQPVQQFSNYYYDGKEDYHYEDEGAFVEGLAERDEEGNFLYKGQRYEDALELICSDDDLLIDYFEMLHEDGGIQPWGLPDS